LIIIGRAVERHNGGVGLTLSILKIGIFMAVDREVFCQESFDKYLREVCQANNISWQRVPKGKDPPDFYLTLNSVLYAVEVTSTEVMRDVTLGKGQIREHTYEVSHTSLVKELEREAENRGILSGLYIVGFLKPLTDQNFYQVKEVVVKELLAYVQRTSHLVESPDEPILYQDSTVCRIGKYQGSITGVFEAFSDSAWTEAPENAEKICKMLQSAITTKKKRLLQKGEVAPKILLLLNTYRFADEIIYRTFVSTVEDIDFFHTVFVV
jgi:hypothetical protein